MNLVYALTAVNVVPIILVMIMKFNESDDIIFSEKHPVAQLILYSLFLFFVIALFIIFVVAIGYVLYVMVSALIEESFPFFSASFQKWRLFCKY